MEVPGIDIHSQWLCFSDWILTHMLPNQTWVHSPWWNKASLLTPGCGEGKCSIYCKAKQGVWATNVQKARTSPFTKRYFKDRTSCSQSELIFSYNLQHWKCPSTLPDRRQFWNVKLKWLTKYWAHRTFCCWVSCSLDIWEELHWGINIWVIFISEGLWAIN